MNKYSKPKNKGKVLTFQVLETYKKFKEARLPFRIILTGPLPPKGTQITKDNFFNFNKDLKTSLIEVLLVNKPCLGTDLLFGRKIKLSVSYLHVQNIRPNKMITRGAETNNLMVSYCRPCIGVNN